MKKKLLTTIIAMAVFMGNSMTAFAVPEIMPDGTIFDAEYYAQKNPDVTAAVGTDKDALYGHYVTFGRNEGRLPYEVAVKTISEIKYELTTPLPQFSPEVRARNDIRVPFVMGADDGEYYVWGGSRSNRMKFQSPEYRMDFTNDPVYLAIRDTILEAYDRADKMGSRLLIDIPVRYIDTKESGPYY